MSPNGLYPGDKTIEERMQPTKLWKLGQKINKASNSSKIYKELMNVNVNQDSTPNTTIKINDRLGENTADKRINFHLQNNSKSIQCELLFKSRRNSESKSPVIRVDKQVQVDMGILKAANPSNQMPKYIRSRDNSAERDDAYAVKVMTQPQSWRKTTTLSSNPAQELLEESKLAMNQVLM